MSAINATAAGATTAGQSDGFSALSSGQFMQIVLTELTSQDPLKPSDTSALLEQLSSIRAIESDLDMSDRLGSLVSQNELASAAGLIGKIVSGLDENGRRAADFVSSVSRTELGAILNLRGGERVPMSSVDEIVTDTELFGLPEVPTDGTGTDDKESDTPA